MENEKMNFDEKTLDKVLFLNLTMQYQQAVMIFLGKMTNPTTGKLEQDLEAAEMHINILTMLQRKTEGNLEEEEANYLQNTLTNLRLNFVEESKAKQNKPEEKPDSEASDTGDEKMGADNSTD